MAILPHSDRSERSQIAPAAIPASRGLFKKLNTAVRQASEHVFYQTTLQCIGDGVIATDTRSAVTFMNPVAETLTGWTQEEAVGRFLHEVFETHNEASNDLLEDPASKVLRLNRTVMMPKHILLKRKDGRRIAIDDSSAPILDEHGTSIGVVLVFRDITQRRLGEEALRQCNKVAMAGRLAAIVSHEINNPLTAMNNLLFILQEDPSLGAAAQKNVRLLTGEVNRVSVIADHALGLHKNLNKHVAVNVPKVLDELLAGFSPSLASRSIRLDTHYSSTTGIIALDGDLRQVFTNLMANAVDALRLGGVLSVKTRDARNASLAAVATRAGDALRPEGIEIEITDTGAGIKTEDLQKIFEPFYTTKNEGTGLGLWVAREIVEEHAGSIDVTSSVSSHDHGTRFTLFFPMNAAGKSAPGSQQASH